MTIKKITIEGNTIRLSIINGDYYLSLSDLAKQQTDRPEILINRWMSSQNTLSYLKAWEEAHNADFKTHETLDFKGWEQLAKHYILSSLSMSPKKWITYTNGIGFEITQEQTWAAESIALTFAAWMNPAYQIALEGALQEYKNSVDAILDEPLNYN